jgi:hypothetical protein
MTYFVGLDWAAREHAVCVVDEHGAVVSQGQVRCCADSPQRGEGVATSLLGGPR